LILKGYYYASSVWARQFTGEVIYLPAWCDPKDHSEIADDGRLMVCDCDPLAIDADPKWLVSVAVGDWLIVDQAGNVYSCSNAKFAEFYYGA
jgi:hypothetical protein